MAHVLSYSVILIFLASLKVFRSPTSLRLHFMAPKVSCTSGTILGVYVPVEIGEVFRGFRLRLEIVMTACVPVGQ